jgi:hypothetical protein
VRTCRARAVLRYNIPTNFELSLKAEAKMSTPNTEPNSLPLSFADWKDWRAVYAGNVKAFNASPKTYSDEVLLRIRLKRLGFVGIGLEREIEFVKEGVS